MQFSNTIYPLRSSLPTWTHAQCCPPHRNSLLLPSKAVILHQELLSSATTAAVTKSSKLSHRTSCQQSPHQPVLGGSPSPVGQSHPPVYDQLPPSRGSQHAMRMTTSVETSSGHQPAFQPRAWSIFCKQSHWIKHNSI